MKADSFRSSLPRDEGPSRALRGASRLFAQRGASAWAQAARFLVLPAAWLCCHCTDFTVSSNNTGGGSEAVALVGSVGYPDGRPAASARVRLRPKLFLPDTAGNSSVTSSGNGTVLDVKTDSSGAFRMDSVKRGDYYLEISDSSAQGLLIPCTLTGDTDRVTLAKAALQPTGIVTGSIVPPDGFAGRTYVQVYGLDRQVKADSATGKFRMDGLPAGTYTLHAVYSAPAVDPREIDSVAARAADTTDIGAVKLASFENENYTAWPQSRRIYLNTTAAGANVAGNADDFALLVRLTSAQFDFSQSRGNDIRFADSKGKRLRYQIERWDSANGLAEVWVRLDRVNGNSNAQFLTMYWGVPGAEDLSDGRMVFAAEAGFAGTWHLSESAPDTVSADLYADAAGYDPAADRVASSNRSGLIGFGANFNLGDYISVPVADPLLQPNGKLTVSAWIRAARTGAQGGNILSMGDSYNLRVNPDGSVLFNLFTGTTAAAQSPKGLNVLDSAWHHVSGSYDGAFLNLYVDGKPVAKAPASGELDYRFWPGFILGRHGNRKPGYDFIGGMDEAEVSGEIARSADWIKLQYENQRADSKLLEFR